MIKTEEDSKWLLRVHDLAFAADNKNVTKFTKFCDQRLIYVAKNFAGADFKKGCFWGGYERAERQILGFFPDYLEPDTSLFPISLLKIKGADGLSHRDFLGSLLGLGISRDVIGDILVCDDLCYVFVYSGIEEFILYNLKKVANKNVTVKKEDDLSVVPEKKFSEISGTVSSERLDCIVSLFTKKSRSDSLHLISSERVFLNHAPCTAPSAKINEGDVISVRKFGKAQISKIGPETKKGRIRIVLLKYV